MEHGHNSPDGSECLGRANVCKKMAIVMQIAVLLLINAWET